MKCIYSNVAIKAAHVKMIKLILDKAKQIVIDGATEDYLLLVALRKVNAR